MRIVVVNEGGCMSEVLCDDPKADVELIDLDDIDADTETLDQLQNRLSVLEKELTVVG